MFHHADGYVFHYLIKQAEYYREGDMGIFILPFWYHCLA